MLKKKRYCDVSILYLVMQHIGYISAVHFYAVFLAKVDIDLLVDAESP